MSRRFYVLSLPRFSAKPRKPGIARTKSAFTLIELLVVIAIIAILAAILFPVFAQAREKARQATCLSNLKQLGLAAMQYVQDYDEMYPPVWADGQGQPWTSSANYTYSATLGVGDQAWSQLLQPYLKNTRVFQCPSGLQDPNIATGADYTDYAYNILLTCVPLGKMHADSMTVMFMDGTEGTAKSNEDGCNRSNVYPPVSDCTVGVPYAQGLDGAMRHQGGGTYAMADGHVKWLKGDVGPDGKAGTSDDICPEILNGNSSSLNQGKYTFAP